MGHKQGAFSNHRRSSRGNWRPHVFGKKKDRGFEIWGTGTILKEQFKKFERPVESIWVFWAHECHLELNWNWSSGQTSTKRKSANVCSFLESTCQLFRPIRMEQRGNVCSFLENTRQLFRPIRIEQRGNVCSFLESTCQLFRPIQIEHRGNVCSFLESTCQLFRPIQIEQRGNVFSFLENTYASCSDLYEQNTGEMCPPFLKTHMPVVQTYTKDQRGNMCSSLENTRVS